MSKNVVSSEIQMIIDSKLSKSDKFRSLYDHNLSISEISKLMNSHYSFVYGVIDRHDSEMKNSSNSEESKADKFRSLADQGLTVGEIAKQMNSNYSYVFTVVKKHRLEISKLKK